MVFYSSLYVVFPVAVVLFVLELLFGIFTPRSFLVFFAVLIFLLGLSTWMILRFDRQAGFLDRAARKIADGDLDYQLGPQGDSEFSGLIRSLERLRRKLKDEQDRRFGFLMAVSHDLNTPLTSIKGYLEALADGLAEDPEQGQKYLEIMQQKTLLLEDRIQELMEYVKTETGDWRIHQEEVLLLPFLSSLGEAYKHDASVIRREFEFFIDLPDTAYVLADRVLLGRVFENLFGNAFRYTNPGDRIVFTASATNREVVVSVKDSGIGIEESRLPFIFDPFYRASQSRSGEGHGLGLSTVKNILRAHDWGVDVRSRLGEGSEFVIRMAPYFYRKIPREG